MKSDRQVAKLLDMEAPALFNHKKRGTIPYKKITTYCEKNGLLLDDVLASAGDEEAAITGKDVQGQGGDKEASDASRGRDSQGNIISSSVQEEELLKHELIAAQKKIIGLMEENATLKDQLLKKPAPLSKKRGA